MVSAARQFRPENDEMPLMQAFLSHASLEAGEGQSEAYQRLCTTLTLHSAKGLELPLYFLAEIEEGLVSSSHVGRRS